MTSSSLSTREKLKIAVGVSSVLLFALLGVSAAIIYMSQGIIDHVEHPIMDAKDRPLLSRAEALRAQRSGFIAFRDGDQFYIVENLPEEYIDYSLSN